MYNGNGKGEQNGVREQKDKRCVSQSGVGKLKLCPFYRLLIDDCALCQRQWCIMIDAATLAIPVNVPWSILGFEVCIESKRHGFICKCVTAWLSLGSIGFLSYSSLFVVFGSLPAERHGLWKYTSSWASLLSHFYINSIPDWLIELFPYVIHREWSWGALFFDVSVVLVNYETGTSWALPAFTRPLHFS